MIDALIAGKLHGKPQQRTGQSGKPFVVAKVRAPLADGEAVFVNVIAFDRDLGATLMALGDGDSVSLSGALTPKAWTDRNGEARPSLDMVVHAVLTAYQVNRQRKTVDRKVSQSNAEEFDGDSPF